MNDLLAMTWKEFKEIIAMWRGRNKISLVLLLGVFGVFLPLQSGPEWMTSPAAILSWSWFPILMVSSITADSFAGERERHTLETLLATRLSDSVIVAGKIIAAVVYGLVFFSAFVLISMISINVAYWSGSLLLFPRLLAVSLAILESLGAILAAALGVIVSLKSATVRQAQQTLNLAIIGVILIPVAVVYLMPTAWRKSLTIRLSGMGELQLLLVAAVAFAAIDAVALIIARRAFRRPRLILE